LIEHNVTFSDAVVAHEESRKDYDICLLDLQRQKDNLQRQKDSWEEEKASMVAEREEILQAQALDRAYIAQMLRKNEKWRNKYAKPLKTEIDGTWC